MTSRYSLVPADAFLDARLTPADVRVLGVLGSYLDKWNECFPSQGRVAEEARLNRTTVNRALKKLVELGYVTCRQKYPGRVKSVLVYHVELSQNVRAELAQDQPDLFPTVDLGRAEKAAKSDVALSNIPTRETHKNQMLPSSTSEKQDVGSGQHKDVASGHHTNIPSLTPHSSVSYETGHAAEDDDSENTAPPSSQELKRSIVYSTGKLLLTGHGVSKKSAGAFLGRLVKDFGLEAAFAAVTAATREPPIDPKAWLVKAAAKQSNRKPPPSTEPEDWDQLVTRYARRGVWPARLGPRPDEIGYRGTLAPLEAVMARGRVSGLNLENIKFNIDRLKAERAA